jgi:hypothetical protein
LSEGGLPAKTPTAGPNSKKALSSHKDRGLDENRWGDAGAVQGWKTRKAESGVAMDVDRLEETDRWRVERWERDVDGDFGAESTQGGGPPRSKPNAPVRKRAVTFNEPESEEGQCQLEVRVSAYL